MPNDSMQTDVITIRDMCLDEVDSGLPRLTLRPMDGEARTYSLTPDAVRALVDTLCGVAAPAEGEVRVIVKGRVADVLKELRGLEPPERVTDEHRRAIREELDRAFPVDGPKLGEMGATSRLLIALTEAHPEWPSRYLADAFWLRSSERRAYRRGLEQGGKDGE